MMVATVTVLNKYSHLDGKPFDGGYFLGLANPNYYLNGGEPPGRWFGGASEKLSLVGEVYAEPLQNMLQGLAPDGTPILKQKRPRKQKLGQAKCRRAEHCPGLDVTFSVPKSVSVLWATASPYVRDQIERAFNIAVTSTLEWLEKEIPLARRGKGGHKREFAKLVVAMFDHSVSRVSKSGRFEPQLHRHCLIMNVAELLDGSYGAINSPLLHKWVRTLGPMFRATLAFELSKLCGFRLYRPLDRHKQPQSWFEILGVPEDLCQYWSSRKSEMDELLAVTVGGVKLGREYSTGQARESVNLASRRAKTALPPRAQLFSDWRKTAQEFGFGESQANRLLRQPRTASPEKVFQTAWREAEAKLTQGQAHFSYREALQRVCEAAQDRGISGIWLAQRLTTYLEQSQAIIPLGEHQQEKQFTTRTMWQLEKKFLNEVTHLSKGAGAVVEQRQIEWSIRHKPTIASDQERAVRQLLGDDRQLRVMTGVAGAGKSFALDAVREGLERSGYRVLGGALAAVAKEELAEKANIKSRTVASYLYQLDKSLTQAAKAYARHSAKQLLRAVQGKATYAQSKLQLDGRDVLILDEAAMLDTRNLYRLCREVRKAGATIILVGDEKQLQPIEAGGALAYVKGLLQPAHLTTNMRQKDKLDREASLAIREGRAEDALKIYRDRDRIVVKKDKKATITRLVNDWAKRGGVEKPSEHMIFTQTRDEAKLVNRLCQRQRIKHGATDASQRIVVGNETLCQGDRILFHKARFADGIANGYRGTIVSVRPLLGQMVVQLDVREGQQPRTVTVRTRDYGDEGITLAYACTTHKMQGATCGHAYMLLGGSMTDRQMAYVQATRGKLSTWLYVDEPHAGPELKDLARAMNQSRAKRMAHDLYRDSLSESKQSLQIVRSPQR